MGSDADYFEKQLPQNCDFSVLMCCDVLLCIRFTPVRHQHFSIILTKMGLALKYIYDRASTKVFIHFEPKI